MSSYLKRAWRGRPAPRGVGGSAAEEWEELRREASSGSEEEEADGSVVVGSASHASPTPAPKAKKTAPPKEEEAETSDAHPCALLCLRIRPASAAFWVRTLALGARQKSLRRARRRPQRAPAPRAARPRPWRAARGEMRALRRLARRLLARSLLSGGPALAARCLDAPRA